MSKKIQSVWFPGEFYENLELQNFPRDVQDLSVCVSSELHTNEIDLLIEDQKMATIDVSNFRVNQEWKLFKHVESNKLPGTSNCDVELRHTAGYVIAKCRVVRRSQYFMFNNVIVMFCLVLLSFTIYAFDPLYNMSRIGASINLLLVAVAFKLSVSSDLPLISYLTYLDVYMIGVILHLCFNIIIFAFLSIIRDRTDTALFVDKLTALVLGVTVAMAHLIYAYIFIRKTNEPIKEMENRDVLYDNAMNRLKLRRRILKAIKVIIVQNSTIKIWRAQEL